MIKTGGEVAWFIFFFFLWPWTFAFMVQTSCYYCDRCVQPGQVVSVSQLSMLAVAPAPHLCLQGGQHLVVLGDGPPQRGEGDRSHFGTTGFP